MPADSSTAVEVGQGWQRADELQARTLELFDLRLREVLVSLARLGGDKKAQVGKPLTFDDPARPGVKRRTKRKVTMAEAFQRVGR